MAVFAAALSVLPAAHAADSFSPVIPLRNASTAGYGLSPVHGSLLRDGSVLFIGAQRKDGTNVAPVVGPKFTARYSVVPTGSAWPALQSLRPEFVPYDCGPGCVGPGDKGTWRVDDTVMCAGHTLLSDGSFFAVSGTRFWNFQPDDPKVAPYSVAFGLDHNFHYNPTTAVWTRLPGRLLAPGDSNQHGRWYGTATRLADGRVLSTSGFDLVGAVINDKVIYGTQTFNVSVEAFDPGNAANPRQILSDKASTPPNIFNVDYTHVFQFPFPLGGGQDVLMIGMSGDPIFMSPTTTPNWLPTGQIRPGMMHGYPPLHGSATLMLPLRLTPRQWGYNLGAIMVVGGGGIAMQSSADVYDAAAGAWAPNSIAIGEPRHHPSTVLLPDGRVFVIGGHNMTDGTMPHPVGGVMLTPSATGYTASPTAAMAASRGYHAVALLLPDGRVLVAGGRSGGADSDSDERPNAEYYHPDYMTGPRPAIVAAPQEIRYDQPFTMSFSGAKAASELVLMGTGSMTHSFDANQRSVQLAHSQTGPNSVVGMVVGGERFAPPGIYMLFLLDENRRPSTAVMVRVARQ